MPSKMYKHGWRYLLEDNTDLGDQIFVAVSPGFAETSVADTICQNDFVSPISPSRSLAVSTAAAKVNESSSTLVFAPRPFLSVSFDNKLCADTSIDSERLKVPILPLFALRLNAPRQNRLQGGHFDRWVPVAIMV